MNSQANHSTHGAKKRRRSSFSPTNASQNEAKLGYFKLNNPKQVLAWWPYRRTIVTRRWIAEKLQMVYETRVSQAVSWVEKSRGGDVSDMKNETNGRLRMRLSIVGLTLSVRPFLETLLTEDTATAQAALYRNTS